MDTELGTEGRGGIIREYNKYSECVWEFRYASEEFQAHHDFAVLPNGNLLVTAWQKHPPQNDAPNSPHFFFSDTVVEV